MPKEDPPVAERFALHKTSQLNGKIDMLTRRNFFKSFGIFSLGFALLPKILFKNCFSNSLEPSENPGSTKNWLYGFPKRGCSTPLFPQDHFGSFENRMNKPDQFFYLASL